MRKISGLATAAVLATAVVGMQAGSVTRQAATSPDAASLAIAALPDHPGAARATAGQKFVVTDTIVDNNGTTHVRMDRRYQGLRVVGGDLVVHTAPGGDLRASARPSRHAGRRCHHAGHHGPARRDARRSPRPEPTAEITKLRSTTRADPGRRRHRRHAPPGVGGHQRRPAPRRRDAQPALDVRRRDDRQGDPPRGAHPDRRRLRARRSTAAPSRCRSRSRARRTSSGTRPAATPTRPT